MDEVRNRTPTQTPPPQQPTITQPIEPVQQHKSKKGKLLIILFFAFCFVLAGLIAYFLFNKEGQSLVNTILPLASNKNDEVNNQNEKINSPILNLKIPDSWKTLDDSECGVSLKYPPTWEILRNTTYRLFCNLSLVNSMGQSASHFSVLVINQSGGWERILNKEKIIRKLTIAGFEAVEAEAKVEPAFASISKTSSYFFHDGDYVYTVMMVSHTSYPKEHEVLKQILSTITVTGKPKIVEKADEHMYDKADNTARRSHVTMILNAIGQYVADDRGVLPSNIPLNPQEIRSDGIDICALLVPTYIYALPIDPSLNKENITDCSKPYKTGYVISKDNGSRVTVSAPLSSLGESISVSR